MSEPKPVQLQCLCSFIGHFAFSSVEKLKILYSEI